LPQPKLPGGVYRVIRYIQIMKRGGKTLAYVLSALALGNGAQALVSDSSGGPYHGIVARNVFDIHPPVPHDPALDKPPTPPPPNIRLQGITDILHRKQVIFKVQLPSKPPAPAKEESYILTEGQREGEIEVLEIDVKAGTVKMNDYGVITNLSIELNGEKLVSGPPAGAPPPVPGAQPPAPGAFVPPSLPAGRMPPRTLRLPGAAGAQNSPGAQSTPGISANPGYSGGPVSAGGTANQQQADPSDPNVRYRFNTLEEQELAIEAQRLKYQQEGNPQADALPPTRISRNVNVATPHPNNPAAP
jgi:hypothetical protein